MTRKTFAPADDIIESGYPSDGFGLNDIYGPLETRHTETACDTSVRSAIFSAGVPG